MRMKMFAAESLEAAKAMIFAEMGADAVILSEREIEGGVEVRAVTDKLGGGVVPRTWPRIRKPPLQSCARRPVVAWCPQTLCRACGA